MIVHVQTVQGSCGPHADLPFTSGWTPAGPNCRTSGLRSAGLTSNKLMENVKSTDASSASNFLFIASQTSCRSRQKALLHQKQHFYYHLDFSFEFTINYISRIVTSKKQLAEKRNNNIIQCVFSNKQTFIRINTTTLFILCCRRSFCSWHMVVISVASCTGSFKPFIYPHILPVWVSISHKELKMSVMWNHNVCILVLSHNELCD